MESYWYFSFLIQVFIFSNNLYKFYWVPFKSAVILLVTGNQPLILILKILPHNLQNLKLGD